MYLIPSLLNLIRFFGDWSPRIYMYFKMLEILEMPEATSHSSGARLKSFGDMDTRTASSC